MVKYVKRFFNGFKNVARGNMIQSLLVKYLDEELNTLLKWKHGLSPFFPFKHSFFVIFKILEIFSSICRHRKTNTNSHRTITLYCLNKYVSLQSFFGFSVSYAPNI